MMKSEDMSEVKKDTRCVFFSRVPQRNKLLRNLQEPEGLFNFATDFFVSFFSKKNESSTHNISQ